MDESLVSNRQSYPTAAEESNRPRDRLSELPNSLTLEILSLLEMKDVVRTTILSKRWKDLWTTVPCLDFGHANRSFIQGALSKWNGDKIIKFRIDFKVGNPPTRDMLDSWLLVPIEKQVEDLYVDFGYYVGHEFWAPQPLYSCSSITKFFLSNLKIEENVQWNQLKSLTIEGMHKVSEDAMNKILSGAPQLEELVLNLFEVCGKFKIRSTSLKRLHIGKHHSCFTADVVRDVVNSVQRIEAPNLLTLEVSPLFFYGDCVLDVPSLTNAILHCQETDSEFMMGQFSSLGTFKRVFRGICHVEKVTLSSWCTEYLVLMKMKDMVVRFSNATFLELYAREEAQQVLHILETFPNLMKLKVRLDQGLEYTSLTGEAVRAAMVKTTLPSPSLLRLKTVEITLFGWDEYYTPIFPLMEIQMLLENAHLLEKMVLRLGGCFTNLETYTMVEETVLGMPRSSPTALVVISQA